MKQPTIKSILDASERLARAINRQSRETDRFYHQQERVNRANCEVESAERQLRELSYNRVSHREQWRKL